MSRNAIKHHTKQVKTMSKWDPRDIIHNPEGDNSYPLPEHLKHLEKQGISACVYGRHVFLRGPQYSTNIIDELFRRKNNQESIVITVTGEPGSGKTYFAMSLAQILDDDFYCTDTPEPPPREDNGQIAFTREQLTHLVSGDSPLKRGQVILMDESHFGIGARDWNNRAQKDLINLISAVRSRGYVLILVVLHTSMVDKIVRDFVTNFEFHMVKRGSAIAYRRWFPQFATEAHSKRLGKMTLTLPESQLCNYATCLDCEYLHKDMVDRCLTIRAIYERRKARFLDKASEAANPTEEKKKLTLADKLDLIMQKKGSLFLSGSRLSIQSLIPICEENELPTGNNTLYRLRNAFEKQYPEIITALKRKE